MDFKDIIADLLSSFLIVFRRSLLLIISPYKTLRKISLDNDYTQIVIILGFVLGYFLWAGKLREFVVSPLIIFLFFLFNFVFTVCFFYYVSRLLTKNIKMISLVFTLSYSLLPTLVWFTINSLFYFLIPPPRTISILGKSFSIIFVAFSISLLIWKVILFYLAIRFSTKFNFFRTIYLIILYLCIFIPYSLLLYNFKIFRIPFI